MKKLLFLIAIAIVFASTTSPVMAVKPAACATIQGGTITDSAGQQVTLGYDQWGYNYQANMFNGWYGNYSRPTVPATSGDSLMMKWNDAWLSSKDCDDDHKLDRHFGFVSYRGSGAWLTNHASGAYDVQNISGSYVFNYEWNDGYYPNDVVLTQTGQSVTGTIGWPSGQNPYLVEGTVVGTVVGDVVTLTVDYNDRAYDRTMTGTIGSDGSMSGNWTDGLPSTDLGTWSTVAGISVKSSCSWSDFVKIVAAPADAVMVGTDWTLGGTVMGPAIWGDFAIIQEVSSDPCGQGVDLMNYKSQLRSGLGNW